MSDLISQDVGNERERAKIKTNFAKIIVEGTAKEPYYSILYYDPKRKEYINGYGSYCIDYVFNWLAEEFEINDDVPAVDAESVRLGKWAHLGGDEWCCTACGEVIHTEGSWEKPTRKYCHECGAKIDGGNEE